MIQKRWTALLLSTVLLVTGTTAAFNASAATQSGDAVLVDTSEYLNDLKVYKTRHDLNVLAIFAQAKIGQQGDLPIFTEKSILEVDRNLRIAYEYYEVNGSRYEDATPEEITRVYDNLQTAIDCLKVRSDVLWDFYDMAKEERNDDYYYKTELWNRFQTALITAEKALENPDDDTVTTAYYELRTLFNDLCRSNQIVGDFDQDGQVKLNDILFLQKYLAKIIPVNSSQKIIADYVGDNLPGVITTENVIILQKYLAEMNVYFKSSALEDLNRLDKNPLINNHNH